jgi:hypothetical protein
VDLAVVGLDAIDSDASRNPDPDVVAGAPSEEPVAAARSYVNHVPGGPDRGLDRCAFERVPEVGRRDGRRHFEAVEAVARDHANVAVVTDDPE